MKGRGQVAERFRNQFVQTLDQAKGQVSVPASFRKVIERCDPEWVEGKKPRFVVLFPDPDPRLAPELRGAPCLDAYTIEASDDIVARIEMLPRGTPARKYLERMFFTLSFEAEVQPDGRIVIPKERREQIGLTDKVLFVGLGERFQIWNPETFEDHERQELRDWRAAQPAGFDPLSILPALPPRTGG